MLMCILIPTYQRNETLFRLLDQCNRLVSQYTGPHRYEIVVTDSDPNNPQRAAIEKLCQDYVVNQGKGFDDNLFFFYKDRASKYAHILSISDDDMFASTASNPLNYIDASVGAGKTVLLFNHYDYNAQANAGISLGKRFFNQAGLSSDLAILENELLKTIPRHVGILYATEAIGRHLESISKFRGTLHLYAALMALEPVDRIAFIDLPLFYYCVDPHTTGAWENSEKVFTGLITYLSTLKATLPREKFEIALKGFFDSYFGEKAWLRGFLGDRNVATISEPNIYRLLGEIPPERPGSRRLMKSLNRLFG